MLRCLLFCGLLLGAGLDALCAATYYVSPHGNDRSGTGTLTQPWQTIDKGRTALSPGDELILLEGTYREPSLRSNPFPSGTDPSKPTRITGQNAIFKPDTVTSHIIQMTARSNIVLSGFTIDRANNTSATYNNIKLYGCFNITLTNMVLKNNRTQLLLTVSNKGILGSGLTILDSEFENWGDGFVKGDSPPHAVYLASIHNVLIDGCRFINGTRDSGSGSFAIHRYNTSGKLSTNGIVRNNFISNVQNGMVLSDAAGWKVYNNVIQHTSNGGIRIDGANSSNNEIFNNTIQGVAPGPGLRTRRGAHNNFFANNILWETGSTSIRVGAGSHGNSFTNNLYPGSFADEGESVIVGSVNADPRFVDSPVDLRLDANSPARNAGVDLSAYFTADHDGYTRGRSGRWDIGAFEHRQQVIIDLQASSGALQAPMTITSESLASQSLGQSSQPTHVSSPVAGSGSVTFQFEAPSAGDYVIWCHMLAPSGWIDSVSVSVNDGEPDLYFPTEGADFDTWSWSRVNGERTGAPYGIRLFQLHQGINTIRFATVVPYVGLSRIVVTDDLEFLPDDGVPVRPQPPTVSIERIGTSTILGWPSVPDKYYHIFYKHNLSDVHWLRLNPRNVYRANGTWVELVDKNTAAGRFYAVYAAP